MLLHVFVRFEPRPGKQDELRDELALILGPTRSEPSCLRINLYESAQEPCTFTIHSQWVDEAAFENHAERPHMKRFLGLVGELIAHPVQAVRTRQIG